MRQVGTRRKREGSDYKRAVAEHLAAYPSCQIGPVIAAAGHAVRCLGEATHVHHTRGRGRYLCDRATFLSSCSGECHPQFCHVTNVAEAVRLGLIVR